MKQGPIRIALKVLIIVLVLRPFMWFILGINRYSRLKLPETGPLIIAPNHNSHLDTALLYALVPLKVGVRMRAVAAGDYFGKIPVLSWFLFDFCGMLPIWRPQKEGEVARSEEQGKTPLSLMKDALKEGDVLLLFPEGTRGKPQQRSTLKKGIAILATDNPEIPVYPVFIKGLGKALPRDSFILIPLIPTIVVQEPIHGQGKDQATFLSELEQQYGSMEKAVAHKDRRTK